MPFGAGIINDTSKPVSLTVGVTITVDAISDNALISIATVGEITGLANGTPKNKTALGLASFVRIVTAGGDNIPARAEWDVESADYDPSQKNAQTFEIKGELILPDNVTNPLNIQTGLTVSVTVNAAAANDTALIGITNISDISNLANGTPKDALSLGLPAAVFLITSEGAVAASVEWDVWNSPYDPSGTAAQTFAVNGRVLVPTGVINPDNIPLTVSVNVTVGEFTANNNDALLLSVVPPDDVSSVPNGAGKNLIALGLPLTVLMETDMGDKNAAVYWDVEESQYDQSNQNNQSFTVYGTASLPEGVVNGSGLPLDVEVLVNVNAAFAHTAELIGIEPPAAITGLANGTPATQAGLGLPTSVTLMTTMGYPCS